MINDGSDQEQRSSQSTAAMVTFLYTDWRRDYEGGKRFSLYCSRENKSIHLCSCLAALKRHCWS